MGAGGADSTEAQLPRTVEEGKRPSPPHSPLFPLPKLSEFNFNITGNWFGILKEGQVAAIKTCFWHVFSGTWLGIGRSLEN